MTFAPSATKSFVGTFSRQTTDQMGDCTMRTMLAVAVAAMLLLGASMVVAQDEALEIDRTDPSAVAKAYAQACLDGDLTTAISLLPEGDALRALAQVMVGEMTGAMEQAGFSMERIFLEYMFMPVKMGFAVGDTEVQELDGGDMQVTVDRTWPAKQKLVLGKAEDGTWFVKGEESIKATLEGETSMILTQFAQQLQGGGPGGPNMYESETRLRRLAQIMVEYAKEHDNMLPPADEWMDELEPYVLDAQMFQNPGDPDSEYGYAMNLFAGGQPMPGNWGEQQKLVLLMEWRGAERNAAAAPEELLDMEPFWPEGTVLVANACGNTWRLPPGTTFEEAHAADKQSSICSSHVSALIRAARRFTRDNDGLLPAAESWQDDIAIYLLEETGIEDVFRCPAAPELDYAYAINTEVAGMNARELKNHDSIVLFFEADLDIPNAAGNPMIDAAKEGRHLERWQAVRTNTVGYLGGSTGSNRPGQAAGPEEQAIVE